MEVSTVRPTEAEPARPGPEPAQNGGSKPIRVYIRARNRGQVRAPFQGRKEREEAALDELDSMLWIADQVQKDCPNAEIYVDVEV